jgi:hypothetical protein
MDCIIKEIDGILKCQYCGYPARRVDTKRMCRKFLPTGEPIIPPLTDRAINLAKATANHIKTGSKYVSQDIIDARLNICKECPLFLKTEGKVGGTCTHASCGCNLSRERQFLNKLYWADQKCPLDKWGPDMPKVEENGV